MRHRLGWRELRGRRRGDGERRRLDAAPAGAWLGVLGQTGFTAYVGLTRIAQLREGDIVFVSAAAGAVGSATGRFAKLLGAASVVGSAGGTAKARALVDELGYDDAFDYRAESPGDALSRPRPMASTSTSTTSAGAHLVAALDAMRIGGRVALCGMISQFDESAPRQDLNRLIEAVLRRVTLRGFIVRDHEEARPEFEQTVSGWLRSGEVEALQTVVDGIENAVDAFLGMLKGANVGKALVRLDTSWPV